MAQNFNLSTSALLDVFNILIHQTDYSNNRTVHEIHFAINTPQKMKFSIKDFFSKCEQIRRKLLICSHLLKKCLMENFFFCAVLAQLFSGLYRLEATQSISKSEFHYFKLGHYGGHVCL